MSGYYEEDAPRRHRHHHSRRAPVYEEEIIENRTSRPSRQTDLIRRNRDSSSDSVEDIRRDFGPGDYVQRRTTVRDIYPAQRARSADRSRHYDDHYGDPRRSEGAIGGGRQSNDRRSRRSDRYDSDSDSPPPRDRRKSLGEQALGALGLGALAKSIGGGGGDRDRDRGHGSSRRDGRRYDSRSPSPEDRGKKIQQAVKAALTAGAVEAIRSRKDPGGLAGRGKRVLTAAIGAAGINEAISGDPNHHSTRHTIEAALGGLAGNRLINGARSRSRSRGRNQKDGGSGIGGLAAAGGLAALAGKAFNDYRNKSQDRDGGRGRGGYSDDSRSPSPNRKRSKSVSDYARAGMAKLGIGAGPDHDRDRDHRDRDRRSRRDDDSYSSRPRGGELKEKVQHDSSTDYSSSEEERKQKKFRGKEILTGGLATVATIHAAHSVYQSMEKRHLHKELVEEGKMSPGEAKRLKSKALLRQAASVGIAGLGIHGAVSEWKELKEHQNTYHHMCEDLETKREKRRAKQIQTIGQGGSRGSGSRNSEPDLNGRYRDDYGPRYSDGNPYSAGALPPPPMGGGRARY